MATVDRLGLIVVLCWLLLAVLWTQNTNRHIDMMTKKDKGSASNSLQPKR